MSARGLNALKSALSTCVPRHWGGGGASEPAEALPGVRLRTRPTCPHRVLVSVRPYVPNGEAAGGKRFYSAAFFQSHLKGELARANAYFTSYGVVCLFFAPK